MNIRRVLAVATIAAAGLVALAPAAGADPAEPGNYISTVLCITRGSEATGTTANCDHPADVPVHAKVVGGDGFLDLKVRPGHTVEIPGYTGEPWLRVAADGTVQENQASSAKFLNETRYGSEKNIQIPDWVTTENATKHPQWKTVSHHGRYVWHDHRIHYMNPQIAPKVVPGTNLVLISDRDDGIWYIPMTVDGTDNLILGEVRIYPSPSPAAPWGVALILAIALGVAGLVLHDKATRVAGATLVVVGGLAVWAGASELAAVPTVAGGNPIWVALPLVAILLGLGSALFRSAAARSIAALAAAAALGVWAALRVPALDKAVPLGSIDPTLTRFIIGAALGTAVGAAVAAITSGGLALRLADLDDEDEDRDDSATGSEDSSDGSADTETTGVPATDR